MPNWNADSFIDGLLHANQLVASLDVDAAIRIAMELRTQALAAGEFLAAAECLAFIWPLLLDSPERLRRTAQSWCSEHLCADALVALGYSEALCTRPEAAHAAFAKAVQLLTANPKADDEIARQLLIEAQEALRCLERGDTIPFIAAVEAAIPRAT